MLPLSGVSRLLPEAGRRDGRCQQLQLFPALPLELLLLSFTPPPLRPWPASPFTRQERPQLRPARRYRSGPIRAFQGQGLIVLVWRRVPPEMVIVSRCHGSKGNSLDKKATYRWISELVKHAACLGGVHFKWLSHCWLYIHMGWIHFQNNTTLDYKMAYFPINCHYWANWDKRYQLDQT